ncbi:MAG: hypothetical protein N2Z68_01485 [Patescibacteria group bacterium]|nr:hypothetical protein [Patescibacteria group bacterium]
MKVFPVINCSTKGCFEKRLSLAKSFLPKNSWVSVDISQKPFARSHSFFDFKILRKYSDYFKFEGDLMINKEEIYNLGWFHSPFKRLLFYWRQVEDWNFLKKAARKHKKILGVVVEADYFSSRFSLPQGVRFIQVLAVSPGPSAQKFSPQALKIIKFLRKKYPYATISVDGGINPEVAQKVKKAGANIVVSSSYIWKSKNPQGRFWELKKI